MSVQGLEDRTVPTTFSVLNTLDDGSAGSLRWAVGQANGHMGDDTIAFDPAVFNFPQTITLAGTQLELTDIVGTQSITGPVAGVTVSGGGASRVLQVDAGVTVSISGLTITDGHTIGNGGGVFADHASIALTDCTVSGNSAGVGGGVRAYFSTATLTNCTISDNSAQSSGSGLFIGSGSTATLTNCTVSGNSGAQSGGLTAFGTVTLYNTIIAGNQQLSSASDIIGTVSGANNLIGSGGSGGLIDGVDGNIVGAANPGLASLGNYGGPRNTVALLPGSPAINAGASTGAPAADQRGLGRVGAVDIGAFESQGFNFTLVPSSTPQSSNIGTAFGHPLAVSVTANNPVEPVNGGVVTFLPQPAANGASAIFFNPSPIITNGQAAATAAPNNILGTYAVVPAIPGSPLSFALTNTGTPFAALVVNTTSDAIAPGAGLLSLREAIAFNNSAPAGNSDITFDSTVFNTAMTITLTGPTLELSGTTGAASIVGPTAGLTVNGGGLSGVFQVDGGVTASFTRLTMTGGMTSGNGGGLLNFGTTTLSNCTISGNFAANGGGMWNYGTASMSNCTVSGNSASNGGGVYNSGTATLTNCTVSGNSAGAIGGLYTSYATGTATLTNTIVAGNGGFTDVGFGPVSGDNNLIGGNPLLAPLGNYGGPTQTMPLLPGSPAIGAGASGAGIPATDQRGTGRVGAVDIGAFESQGFTLTPVAGSTPQSSRIGTPFAQPLAVNVAANNPIEPVDGGVLDFAANRVNGATGILSAPSAVIASGQAGIIAEPNNAVGSYTVVVSTTGSSPTSFALTNTGPIFTSLIVNTTSDSLFPGAGHMSLREAIAFVNFDSQGISTITFDKHVFATPQTITMTGSQLELSNSNETVTITAPKAGVTVNGSGLSRVFQVDALVTASISGMTITGGNVDYANGGGLRNYGTLTLTNCTVRGNSANGYGTSGGGVFNGGTATLINCTVSGNSSGGGSFSGGGGGGVGNGSRFYAPNATLTMTNCSLSGNSAYYAGGGLYNGATATLTNCTVSGNSAVDSFVTYGGGVATGNFGNSSATTTLNRCTISGNHSNGYIGFGGGLANFGTTTLANCTVSGNSATTSGGGAFSTSAPFGGYQVGTLTLTNCTVSGNSAVNGGGVFTQGGAVAFYYAGNYYVVGRDAFTNLNNCTVSGNSATGDGGGLSTSGFGTTTATNTTIRDNSAVNGGGVSTSGFEFYGTFGGTTNLANCTVSGNSATGQGGGLNNTELGSTTVTGTNVRSNSAVAGGGIANAGTLNVASSNINNNQATSKGGGISTTGGSATFTNSVISANQVNSLGIALGGGIDCENSSLWLTNCTVNANQANGVTALGGGIYASMSTVTLHGCTINGNRANGSVLGEGGGIYNDQGILLLVGTIVKGNKATTDFDNIFVGP
jgi:parallel beta-helix repeat protein